MSTAGLAPRTGLASRPVVCVASRANLPPVNEIPVVAEVIALALKPASTCPGTVTVRLPVTAYAAPVGCAFAGGVAVKLSLNGASGVPAGVPAGLVHVMEPL